MPTEGVSLNRVDVVEVDDAIRRDAVSGGSEFEFGDESSDGARDRRHDDRSDAIGDWVMKNKSASETVLESPATRCQPRQVRRSEANTEAG